MLIEKTKAVIKSTPFLYRNLLPLITRHRNPRHVKQKSRTERALWYFRKICRKLPAIIPDPFFVKIGANDGITSDPCSDIFLKNPRWKGLLIEPVPHCFEKLKSNFSNSNRFILEQVAIGDKRGELPFYYVDPSARDHLPDLPDWHDQLGSLDRNHIIKHLNGALEPYIVEKTVEVNTLSDVLARNHIQRIDILHIDAEGHDLEILKTIDFENLTPKIIFAEHNHLSKRNQSTMRRLLRKNGYSVRNAGRDYLAIHRQTAMHLNLYA